MPRLKHHVANVLRGIDGRHGDARLAVLLGEQRRVDDRWSVGIRFEDLGLHDALGRHDLAKLAVERRDVALGPAADEAPLPARTQIDLAHRDRMLLVEDAPPAPDVLRLGHRLEHESPRRIEQTRHADLAVRRRRDRERIAISYAADDHVSSPSLQLLEVGLQPIEALLPDVTVALGPLGHLLERPRLDAARPPLRLPARARSARRARARAGASRRRACSCRTARPVR